MPTYNAIGLTASLVAADLQTSLSKVVELRMGADQQADAERINKVFLNGRNLPERVIGADGSDSGVQQFLGPQEDLPFFMVEVGDGVRQRKKHEIDPALTQATSYVQDVPMTRSPLSSLGTTPSKGSSQSCNRDAQDSLTPSAEANSEGRKSPSCPNKPAISADVGQVHDHINRKSEPEALCLIMEICYKTFFRRNDRNKSTTGKDLKFEIFLNGQLSATTFIGKRGTAVELYKDKVFIHGMRIHRQVEKPWIYDVEVSHDPRSISAGDRWFEVQRNLSEEVAARGRNHWGDYAPSAELLRSLCKAHLPERVSDVRGLTIIDVVVTAGHGRKDGPEAGYVTRPERMRAPQYVPFDPITLEDPFIHGDVAQLEKAEEASPLRPQVPITPVRKSSETNPREARSTRQRTNTQGSLLETPSKQRAADLFLDIDLGSINFDENVLRTFETSRGTRRRTLKQRLGDLRQMSPQNRAKHLAALREGLGEDAFSALQTEVPKDQQTQPSPAKKLRFDTDATSRCVLDPIMSSHDNSMDHDTIEPTKLGQTVYNQPLPYYFSTSVNHHDMLTQTPMDMAPDAGYDPNRPLFQYVASTTRQELSPKHRRTRASALAHSPCSIPVKTPLRKGRQPKTPTKSTNHNNDLHGKDDQTYNRAHNDTNTDDDSPLLIFDSSLVAVDSPAPTAPVQSPKRGAARTKNAWNPAERTPQQALEAFKAPVSAVGGVVGYSEDAKCQRQIGKARNGEFTEESLVVGMRFLVV